MRVLKGIALFVVLLSSAWGYSQAVEGTVTGTVLNEQGLPIAQAAACLVYWEWEPSREVSQCPVATDKDGLFQIQHVPLRTFWVTASKIEEGYEPLHDRTVMPSVKLTTEEPLGRVIVRLGPKAGILAPVVTDRLTGKPVRDFQISWTTHDPEHPNFRVGGIVGFSREGTRSSFPVGKDLILEFSARGYRNQVYSNPAQPSQPLYIRFQSGEVKQVQVTLEPKTGESSKDAMKSR